MDRATRFLSSLAAALLTLASLVCGSMPAFAQATAMKTIDNVSCAALACTATSPARYCAQGTLLFMCDPVAGFYTAIASGSLTGDPVVVTGSLAINTGSGAAGSIHLEEASPGTDVATITPGTLTASRTITLPDASGTLPLPGIAQTWTAAQTFSGGITASSPVSVTGLLTATTSSIAAQQRTASAPFNTGLVQLLPLQADLTMAAPAAAPTGGSSGGIASCTNAGGQTYRVCATQLNQSGESLCSPTLSFTVSGTSKAIQGIQRPTLDPLATHWSLYYAKGLESFANWYKCDLSTVNGSGVSRQAPYLAAATTQAECACAAGSSVTIANTTGALSVVDPRDGEIRYVAGTTAVAEGATSPVITPGVNRLLVSGTQPQWSNNSGSTYVNLAMESGANFTGAVSVTAGTPISLNGPGGNVTLVWDAASQEVQVSIGGSVRARIAADGIGPGDCPADVYSLTAGRQCYNPTTQHTLIRDDAGVHKVGL